MRTHGYNYHDNVGSEVGASRSQFNSETLDLLSKIYKPIKSWKLAANPNAIISTSPSNNNLYNDVFYFIYSGFNYEAHSGMSHLEFDLFRRLPGSHFLDLPSFKRLAQYHNSLWTYLNHDLAHLSRFFNQVFPKELLLILSSPDKEKLLEIYFQREAMLQGAMWQSIDDYFRNDPQRDRYFSMTLFLKRFFNLQHELTSESNELFSNNFSPTDYRSILKFLKIFYNRNKDGFKDLNISFENFRHGVNTEFKKHLQEIPRNILLRKY